MSSFIGSHVYLIVLMLISYKHFYVTNCTNNLCSVHVLVSVNSNIDCGSINILIKSSTLVLTRAAGCLRKSGYIKKLTCWHPKVVVILII